MERKKANCGTSSVVRDETQDFQKGVDQLTDIVKQTEESDCWLSQTKPGVKRVSGKGI